MSTKKFIFLITLCTISFAGTQAVAITPHTMLSGRGLCSTLMTHLMVVCLFAQHHGEAQAYASDPIHGVQDTPEVMDLPLQPVHKLMQDDPYRQEWEEEPGLVLRQLLQTPTESPTWEPTLEPTLPPHPSPSLLPTTAPSPQPIAPTHAPSGALTNAPTSTTLLETNSTMSTTETGDIVLDYESVMIGLSILIAIELTCCACIVYFICHTRSLRRKNKRLSTKQITQNIQIEDTVTRYI